MSRAGGRAAIGKRQIFTTEDTEGAETEFSFHHWLL